ncbi:MAG: O-antigen ligase family protein, partial [Acidimicrobiia bacterium]|nr:O-antigen ligase family protein [Acidimicrobiia bacterium]
MSSRDRRLAFGLAMVWSFLLPVQLPLLEEGGRLLRLALSDLVLLLMLALVGRHLTLRRGTWSIWHFLLPILIGLNALGPGLVSRYTLFNKLIGMIVLLVSYMFVTSFTTTWADARAWMRAYVLGVTAVTALTLPGFVIGYRLPFVTCHTEACDRLTGLYHDANLYGAAVVLALTMIVVLAGTDHVLLPAPFNLMVMVVLGAGLFFSSSRSSWLGMGVVLLILALTRPARASLMVILGVPIAAAFLLYGTGGQDDEFINRASRTHSIESRFDIIYHALDRFVDAPLFGIGVGRFPIEHGNIIHNTTLWFAT